MKYEGFALVALGSNQPSATSEPVAVLEEALRLIDRREMRVAAVSRWWRTPAFPPGAGPDFVNGATLVETALPAEATLAQLHEVEAALGRERQERWGPRVCDLDLIAHGDRIAPDRETLAQCMAWDATTGAPPAPEELILPHPRMHERAFVLIPLAEIAPDWRHPVLGKTVTEMLAALPQAARDEVEFWG